MSMGLVGAGGLRAGAYVEDGLPGSVRTKAEASSWVRTLRAIDEAMQAIQAKMGGLPTAEIYLAESNDPWIGSSSWSYSIQSGSETDRILRRVRALITEELLADDDDDSSYNPTRTLGVDNGDGVFDGSEDDEDVYGKLTRARREAVYDGTGVDRGYAHGLRGKWAEKVKVYENSNWARWGDNLKQQAARESAARSYGKDAGDLYRALQEAKAAMENQRNRVDRNYAPALLRLVNALNNYEEGAINESRRPGFNSGRVNDDVLELFYPNEYGDLEYPGAEDDQPPSKRFEIVDGYLVATYAGLTYRLDGAPSPGNSGDDSAGDPNDGNDAGQGSNSGNSTAGNPTGPGTTGNDVQLAEGTDTPGGDGILGTGNDAGQGSNSGNTTAGNPNDAGQGSNSGNTTAGNPNDAGQGSNSGNTTAGNPNDAGQGSNSGNSTGADPNGQTPAQRRAQAQAQAVLPWLLDIQRRSTSSNYFEGNDAAGAGTAVSAIAGPGLVIASGITPGGDAATVSTNDAPTGGGALGQGANSGNSTAGDPNDAGQGSNSGNTTAGDPNDAGQGSNSGNTTAGDPNDAGQGSNSGNTTAGNPNAGQPSLGQLIAAGATQGARAEVELFRDANTTDGERALSYFTQGWEGPHAREGVSNRFYTSARTHQAVQAAFNALPAEHRIRFAEAQLAESEAFTAYQTAMATLATNPTPEAALAAMQAYGAWVETLRPFAAQAQA